MLWAAILSTALLALAACHSYHVDSTIENRTGGTIQLLEVDYPSASFGADSLGPGAVFHYRFQIEGSGPLTLQYTASTGHQVHIAGPTLAQGQQGRLRIVLLPGAKAEFYPQLTPSS
jgi:hypothetical protein